MPLAVIGAVAGVAGAAISAGASNHASDVAAQAASQNNALQTSIYNQNSANAQPYIQAGTNAENVLQGFLGVGGDPAKAQTALNDYLNSTGYQFTRQQGLDAVTQSKAASGLLGSGATVKALDAYGTGLADAYGQQYAQDLQGLVGTGQSAASGLAGTGQSYANAVGANTNAAATASANAGLTNASTLTGLIGNAVNAFGATRGASSYGGGSNAMTGYPITFNQPGYAPLSTTTPGG